VAQVLTWDVEYAPASRPWSVVAVRDRRQLYEYLYPRSVVLLSAECWRAERRWLCLLRLALPQARLAVVDGGVDVPPLFDTPARDHLEDYVTASVSRVHHEADTRTLFPRVYHALFPPQRYELIIFDMDGTLLRSDDYSLWAIQGALEEFFADHGVTLPIPPREAIIPRLGVPGNLYRDILPAELREREDELRALVRARFDRVFGEGRAEMFPGANETLAALRGEGRKLALVSHSPVGYFSPATQSTGLSEAFDALLCVGERPGATKADLVAEVMRTLGASTAVMVGDRRLDIEAGRACGCLTVGAGWGFGPAGELDDADIVLSDISQLQEYIHTIEHPEEQ